MASLLEQNGFHVETSWPFLDQETKKSREIDLRAVKNYLKSDEHKLQVFVEILAECKDWGSPIVFLERPKNKRELNASNPKEYVFPKKNYQKPITANSYREIPAFIHLNLSAKHYYFSETSKATQFCKISRKGSDWVANHDGIYDSLILPMAKALNSRIGSLPKYNNPGEWRTIWLFFPVVLLRDHLLSLIGSGENQELIEKGRISFVRNLDSDLLKGEHMIDFVTSKYLEKYLENEIGTFASAVSEIALTSPAVVRGENV